MRLSPNEYSISDSEAVRTYEPYVDSCTRLMLHLLDKAIDPVTSSSIAVVDLGKLMQYYTMEVVGAVTFGHRFGLLDTGEDKECILNEVFKRTHYSIFMGLWPWAHRFIFPLVTLLAGKSGHGFIADFACRMMGEKGRELEEMKSRRVKKDVQEMEDDETPDFMIKLLERHKRDPKAVTTFDLFTMCNTNIGAESESTSIFLSSMICFLAGGGRDGGRSMTKLRNEIAEADEREELSDVITWKESQKLQYFQYVVKEALRMHPAPGFPFPRRAEKNTLLSGTVFPKGTEVGVSPWLLNYDKFIVGEDAEVWRPERWAEEEQAKRMERTNLVWGMGSRNCMGKGIALVEGQKLIPEPIRIYDFELGDELRERVEKGGRWETSTRAFAKMVNFKVKVKRQERGNMKI